MVSFIKFILSFLQSEDIVEVWRVPVTKNLRAHLMGLTVGFMLAVLNIAFHLTASNLLTSVILFIWFALTAYFGGIFFIFTLLLFLFFKAASSSPGSFAYAFMLNAHWYWLGYLGGALLAIFYNDLFYLYWRLFDTDDMKLAFAYQPKRTINIIKSPIKPPIRNEEAALNELFRRKPRLRERRLYKYRIATPPEHPYTIAFVANPKILRRGGNENDNAGYDRDPIIRDRDSFWRAVDRALFSLELDPVIGRPEIWSRIRIVAISNPTLATANGPEYAMLEEFQKELSDSSGQSIENNILDPMRRMIPDRDMPPDTIEGTGTFVKILIKSQEQDIAAGFDDVPALTIDDIDIIYAISASPTHDRAFAHYSDFIEARNLKDPLRPNDLGRRGASFSINFDPCSNKNKAHDGQTDIDPPHTLIPDFPGEPGYRMIHDFRATLPGRIALNVLGARHKTYVHEFAHAMSSAYHGTICDEYTDYFVVRDPNSEPPNNDPIPQIAHFFVNRIERNLETIETRAPIPVSKIFAGYDFPHADPEHTCTHYDSDCAHPSAEESWAGYFPDKYDETTPCTMDRTIGPYRFDELLSQFMYDRLMAKVVRP